MDKNQQDRRSPRCFPYKMATLPSLALALTLAWVALVLCRGWSRLIISPIAVLSLVFVLVFVALVALVAIVFVIMAVTVVVVVVVVAITPANVVPPSVVSNMVAEEVGPTVAVAVRGGAVVAGKAPQPAVG